MLRQADAHELFEWLRGLSFIEADRRGIFPHDLAREALAADLKWRDPDGYAELHARARGYYMQRVQHGAGPDQRRLLADYIYLHRDNPSVRPFFLWQESGTVFTDVLRPDDVEELPEMVARHEGAESAALAAHWLARQPDGFRVLREASGRPVGFLNCVRLEAATLTDRETDPAMSAVWPLLAHNLLRSGETASYFRFWMARETYQSVSPEHTRLVLNMMQHYLVTPGLALSFVVLADPEFWRPAFEYADMARFPAADFTVGDRRYGVYGHDWRTTPPSAWLALMAERELNMGAPPSRPMAEPLIVLSLSLIHISEPTRPY